MRWWAGGVIAVIGAVFVVFAFTEPTGPIWSPRWWRWGIRLAWLGAGAGLILAGAHVAGVPHR